jgi:adenine phosphoribosyltransferase
VHRPEYLKLIDTQTEGPRCDVTPLFADPRAFAALLDDFVALLYEVDFDVIAGIDALGFILGAALALWTHKGFVPVRKGGKLPVPVDMFEFVDYSGESEALELRRDAIDSRLDGGSDYAHRGTKLSCPHRQVGSTNRC